MKKIALLAVISLSGVILAGCNLFGPEDKGVVTVETNAVATGEAKKECLDRSYQWDDMTGMFERPDAKAACLAASNQRNEEDELCEFSKSNCLASNHQWNEEDSSCEYTKEECLEINAQWDEPTMKCEIMPETTERKIAQCFDKEGQWDHSTQTCQTSQ